MDSYPEVLAMFKWTSVFFLVSDGFYIVMNPISLPSAFYGWNHEHFTWAKLKEACSFLEVAL